MRKTLVIPFTIIAVAICILLNTAFSSPDDFVTDKAFETNSTITGMEAVNNIPLDEVFTEDPFKVALVDNGNINPAREISGIEQRNKITGAASYAAFMDSEIDLSKVDVKVQTSILTDMINNYNFGKDKITFIPGTTGTLKGDTSTLQALIEGQKRFLLGNKVKGRGRRGL